jgi:exopolysaccharide biosynthesis polyprenyl glycosylphosphotransferase
MMDLACLVVGSFVGIALRFKPEDIRPYVFDHLEGWLLLCGGIILANYLAGSYRLQYTFSRFNLIVTWLFSIIFVLLILSITSYAWFLMLIGRGVLAYTLVSYSLLSLALKLLLYRYLFRSDVFLCRAVIIGSGDRAASLRRVVENDLVLPPHKVVANIRVDREGDADPVEPVVDGIAVLHCKPEKLDDLVRSLGVSLIIIGLDDMEQTAQIYPQLKRLRFDGLEVLTPLNVFEIYRGLTPLELLNEEVLMQATMESSLPMVWRLKRLLDICVSIFALTVFLPVWLLIAALLKASAPRSPVFYTQSRAGQFGRPFQILKFRTMRPEAERDTGPVWASADDARITPLGGILRRFRLDEVPQFVNILMGEMSLVGPRPERPEIIKDLEEKIPYFSERENITPGLTGWAQIRYPYGSSIDDAKRKLEYDLYYMKHLSLSLDLQIVLSTLRIVLMGKERSV